MRSREVLGSIRGFGGAFIRFSKVLGSFRGFGEHLLGLGRFWAVFEGFGGINEVLEVIGSI